MKLKNSLFLLLIALAGSARAISFRDYYHSHEKEVNAAVATGSLDLSNKELTDLVGFDKVPDIGNLHTLVLFDNQLTALPENNFHDLSASLFVWLFNNPISLSQMQLQKELGNGVELRFKTANQEWAEHDIFKAIENADVPSLKGRLSDIKTGSVRTYALSPIKISKIRDASGDNLLHAAIRDAAKRISVIDSLTARLPEKEKAAAREVQAEQKLEIYDRYMKIISAILSSCDEECVQDMLFKPNAEGQQVIDAIVAKLGFQNPIFEAIMAGLIKGKKSQCVIC